MFKRADDSAVFRTFGFWICFEFRASDFGFWLEPLVKLLFSAPKLGPQKLPFETRFETCLPEGSPHRFVMRTRHLDRDDQVLQPVFLASLLEVANCQFDVNTVVFDSHGRYEGKKGR